MTKCAMLSTDVWRKPETSHGVVTYHKVTLQSEPQPEEPVARRIEVKQRGYEDSEMNDEDLEQR